MLNPPKTSYISISVVFRQIDKFMKISDKNDAENVEIEIGKLKLEAGNWEVESGNWKAEPGSQKKEARKRKMDTGRRKIVSK